jgi:hypothetical protein
MSKNKKLGRPLGAKSCVRVKLKDVLKHLTPEATICVSKSWLEEIGLGIAEAEISTIKVVKPMPENTKVEVKELF